MATSEDEAWRDDSSFWRRRVRRWSPKGFYHRRQLRSAAVTAHDRHRTTRDAAPPVPGEAAMTSEPATEPATDPARDLASTPLPADVVGLLEGLATTRAIRRYRDEPVPPEVLRAVVFAATRAPSGSNRQPFRFLVLSDGPKAAEAKALIAGAARGIWTKKAERDGYQRGSGAVDGSPKARMARTMQRYVDELDRAPVLVLPCLVRYRDPHVTEGASIYPACQNLLLAARALGYGGVMTGFQALVEPELRELLAIPDEVGLAATITLGKPEGNHGPVRRRPLDELVYEEVWGQVAAFAVDPPGTRHTSAGPPRPDQQR
jgi:nitroreductase